MAPNKKDKGLIERLNNHAMEEGKKQTSEIFFLKGIKLLQKTTNKQTNIMLRLSVLSCITTFKLHKVNNKQAKKIPKYLTKNSSRISLAIKCITNACKQKGGHSFSRRLSEEILLSSQNKGVAVEKKKKLQDDISASKIYNFSFRW